MFAGCLSCSPTSFRMLLSHGAPSCRFLLRMLLLVFRFSATTPFCLCFPSPVILLNNQQEFGISAVGFLREPVLVPAMEEGIIMKSNALSCLLLQNSAVSNATDLLFSLSLAGLAFDLRIPVSCSGEYTFG